MTRFLLACLSLLATPLLPAQHWVDLMLDPAVNVYDVKTAFDQAWEGRAYQRGKGWKQFHRWYWHMEQRAYPTGDRPDPLIYLEAMEEVQAMRAGGAARDLVEWESMGPRDWTSISYNPGNGRVNCVALDPTDPQRIYVGSPSGGLWRSNDDGESWEPLFDDLPTLGVSGIVIRPDDPNTILIATGDGNGSDTYSAGVLRSTDGGATWGTTGLDWNTTQGRTTSHLIMHPNDPDLLYCAASNGLHRSGDGGDTWDLAVPGVFRDVAFMPGDTTIVYGCTDRFHKSAPGGLGFSVISAGLPPPSEVGRMAVAVSPADPLVVYVLCSNTTDEGFLGLYRSTDGGETFELRSDTPNLFGYETDGSDEGGQAWYDMALAVDPDDPDRLFVGGINVWRSTDGGSTWTILSHWVFPSLVGYTHADIHSLDVLGGRLWCGSDGGVFVSANAGDTWSNRSFGLDITQFYRLGTSELDPGLILAGAQDNGSNRLKDGQWTHIFGADGMECAVDRSNPNILYASYQLGGLMRSNNNGVEWSFIGDMVPEEGAWVTPFALDPLTPSVIIAGYRNLWVSGDRGDSWYQTTFWPDNEFVRCIAIAPSTSEVIYAGRNGLVQRSDDGGFTWTNIKPGLPNLSPTSFAVDHDDPYHVWISFSGTNNGQKVYESTDGGDTWQNRSAGLPNIPVNSIVAQPGSPNGVYIGTDMGVFHRDDYTAEWAPYGSGMPNVVVTELEVNMLSGKLRAATYGRGIWQADLFFSPFASVAEAEALDAPLLIPELTEGQYRIQTDEAHGRLLELRVVDSMGRLVHQGRDQRLVDLGGRAAGAYNVVMVLDAGTWVRRVVHMPR